MAGPWPDSGSFIPYDDTDTALAALAEIAPVVALTNLPVTSGPARVRAFTEACGAHITATYTSYAQQMRKPNPELWRRISVEHHVDTADIVHLGDQYHQDVLGAVAAGCRAVMITTDLNAAPGRSDWPAGDDRIAAVANLTDAVSVVRSWTAS